MSLRSSSSAVQPALRLRTPLCSASSSRSPLRTRPFSSSAAHARPKDNYYNPWPFKAHLRYRGDPGVPPPLPAIFPQRIVLSDGSTFTSYTTAPSPATVQLTRDVINNALWAPGTERRGVEDDEGRVGRFRRRFEAMSAESARAGTDAQEGQEEGQGQGEYEGVRAAKEGDVAFDDTDLAWMGEGGTADEVPKYERKARRK